jgi:hypothetical protein
VSAPATAGTLARIGSTALYAPPGGEPWVFLLWNGADAPTSLPLDETWADQGAPARPGWYVFLTAVPPEPAAAELETALRSALSAERGWAWSAYAGGPDARLRGAVPLKGDGAGHPVVAADAPVALPPGVLSFGFAAGLRVAASHGAAGEMDGLVATRPTPYPVPFTGVRVALAGPIAGCIFFGALLDSDVVGNRSVKAQADVRMDPLRPFDPHRNRTSPTGTRYVLIAEGAGAYRLERYPSA